MCGPAPTGDVTIAAEPGSVGPMGAHDGLQHAADAAICTRFRPHARGTCIAAVPRMSRVWIVGALAVVACSSNGPGHGGDDDDGVDASTDPSGDASEPFLPPGYVPHFDDLALRCKLISNRNLDDPSA